MYLVRFLVSTVLFLLPLVHAAGIGEVNGANEALASETDKYDANVNNVNIVNGVIGAIGIINDLTDLNNAVLSSGQNGQGTAATNDPGTEQSVVDSFGAFSNALATYMQDLAAKAPAVLGGRPTILHRLDQLLPNYEHYAQFIEGLVEGTAYKDAVDNDASNASEKIDVAQDAFR